MTRRSLLLGVVLPLLALCIETASVSGAPAPAPQTATTASPHIQTVFIIVMENHNWSDIVGSAYAPYINTTLLPIAAHTERYHNPWGIHPSLPNYLWMEAGKNFGIWNDKPPGTNSQSTTNHLVTRLNNLGISWKAYVEDIAGTECPLTSSGYYAVNHNPFVYFNDVTDNQNLASAYCLEHVRPFSQLFTDIAQNALPQYSFIVPNLCDDMHSWCTENPILQGDTWLANNLPAILASPAYVQGGAVFLTWDESFTPEESEATTDADEYPPPDQPIGMIVLSPFAKHGYQNWIRYNHGALLRTVEEIFGIDPVLPDDLGRDADLRDLFAEFP